MANESEADKSYTVFIGGSAVWIRFVPNDYFCDLSGKFFVVQVFLRGAIVIWINKSDIISRSRFLETNYEYHAVFESDACD
ncbi:MAG: hypothetical protein NC098_04815 [Lachnoclostridium sp.]|nr:hypothetical protein [Lachnoclostridium sp.]